MPRCALQATPAMRNILSNHGQLYFCWDPYSSGAKQNLLGAMACGCVRVHMEHVSQISIHNYIALRSQQICDAFINAPCLTSTCY